ncbi:MAG: DUF3313 domain-containing protein [Nitrospirota bacterium]|jgi:hypothetical protein
MTYLHASQVVVGALALALCVSCATKRPVQSGFLEGYPEFDEAPDGSGALVYRRAGLDLGAYDKVMIDPVVIWYSPDSDYRGIHPDELKTLADDFRAAVVAALADAYPVVEAPGPGVLRIRAALTDVVATKPALNMATTVVPVGRWASLATRATTGTHLFVGQAVMEAEFLDAQTHERLAAYIDRRVGTKLKVHTGVTTWGHVHEAFRHWAEKLRKRMDEAHGVS